MCVFSKKKDHKDGKDIMMRLRYFFILIGFIIIMIWIFYIPLIFKVEDRDLFFYISFLVGLLFGIVLLFGGAFLVIAKSFEKGHEESEENPD